MRLLVHLHIFNQNQTPFFLRRLENIKGCQWDLVVTYSCLDKETMDSITAFRPDTTFLQVKNIGYDIWPFIYVVKSVDLSAYDLVLKLHTKSPSVRTQHINGLSFKGYQWRDCMVNALIGSEKIFRKNLEHFEKDEELGFLCSVEVLKKLSKGTPEDLEMLEKECRRLGIRTEDRHYCAGTVFMARIAPYSILKSDAVYESLFEGQVKSSSFGSMSHVYERILAMAVTGAGYKTGAMLRRHPRCLMVLAHNVASPILRRIIAIERFGACRVKHLVIFGIKIPLEKAPTRL